VKPSEFYTGLVADMYDALVSYRAPAAFYAGQIRKYGQPALELGCGTGHPLLDLVEQGLEVHGLDSSADMLARCEAKAQARGLRVCLYEQEMQNLKLPDRYRTIFLAGPSFMLLSELADAERALQQIHDHLVPGGHAIIPLYVPPRAPEAKNATSQWRARESVRSDGATLRVSERFRYDVPRQLRVATLRYEVLMNGVTVQDLERPWLLRWYSQEEFKDLLRRVGFRTETIVGENGGPATESAAAFVFVASRPSPPHG
jgi:SAM-dependent methyltransferase